MTPDLAIAWLLFNVVLFSITLIWGIIRFRRGIWYRKLVLKVQAYFLWGIGGVALLSSIYPISVLYIDHLWFFEGVDYPEVFWGLRKVKWGIFFGFFLFALAFMNANAAIANRLCPEPREFARWTHQRTVSFHRTVFCISILFALLLSIPMMSLQNAFILFLDRPTDKVAPFHFGKDRNFYLFSFPIHQAVSLWVQVLLWTTCIVVGLLYNFYYRRDARSMGRVKRHIIIHGSFLWLMLLGTSIWRSYVNLWSKVYKPSLSESFADYHGLFYADSILAGATRLYCIILLIIGVVIIFNIFWRKRLFWYASLGFSVISFICLIHIYPIAVNFWKVGTAAEAFPVEKDYLTQHIQDTRKAFDLDTINEYKYEKGLTTLDTIEQNADVKKNIQFWDRRVFYNILKNVEIKVHHDFHPYADVDRYRLTTKPDSTSLLLDSQGEQSTPDPPPDDVNADTESAESLGEYRQVLIAAREVDPHPRPKEWGELKLKYTHGYGICMAPVNEVSGAGTPDLWVKGVPISQKEGMNYQELEIEQPRIYYGEMTSDYVIVNTEYPEYNLEEGELGEETNVNKQGEDGPEVTRMGYHYTGTGGVRLGGWFRRFCFAVRFTSIYVLRNSQVNESSRVMFWRRIGTRDHDSLVTDRLSHIAPFLDYDPDPYIVIADGQLWWMVDFYVTSNRFPNSQLYKDDTAPIEYNDLELYAEPRFKRFKSYNYIRNSGVAVVNAYNGQVNFYTEDNDEVITGIYQKAFPSLFKAIDEMPEELRVHRRFPDYLTRIQAKMYGNYHVEQARSFFDNNKQWKIPTEAYYSEKPNHEMMPYYAMLKLPGEEKVEFVNMIPFIPNKKVNFMKGWMIARCDPPHYGERLVYKLPEGDNVYGPQFLEVDISKDQQLSEIFFKLRQTNDIIMGNQHVVPIEDGIFYIKPIFVKPKEIEDENGTGGVDSTNSVRNFPSLISIVVKAEEYSLAADMSFDVALRNLFLRQTPIISSTENGEETASTLSEQMRVFLKTHQDQGKALEEIFNALEGVENGNGVAKGKKKKN